MSENDNIPAQHTAKGKIMANQWDPQIVIPQEVALNLIQHQFPHLQANYIQLFGNGWDNTAYLINDLYIFRFPRREVAVQLLQHEIAALPIISKNIDVPVPQPTWIGKPTQDYPWPFVGYRMLPGIPAERADLTDEQRINLAQPLAQFLKKLHAISIDHFPSLPHEIVFQRLGLDYIIPTMRKNMERIDQFDLLEYKNTLTKIIEQAHNLRSPENNTLIHGDLYIRHILINPSYELAGIIDWGDVQIGDAAMDLAVAHSFLPPQAHEIFKHTYGYISDQTWQLARLRAVHVMFHVILYAHDIGDEQLVKEAQKSLRYIVEHIN